MRVLVRCLLRDENGQDLVEWAMLLAMVALGSAALVSNSGSSMSSVWGSANLALKGQATSGATAGAGSTGAGSSGSGATGQSAPSGSGTTTTTTRHRSGGTWDGSYHHWRR